MSGVSQMLTHEHLSDKEQAPFLLIPAAAGAEVGGTRHGALLEASVPLSCEWGVEGRALLLAQAAVLLALLGSNR